MQNEMDFAYVCVKRLVHEVFAMWALQVYDTLNDFNFWNGQHFTADKKGSFVQRKFLEF